MLILQVETYQKWFSWYHLSCSFKIFINVFAFLYVMANSEEICEEISFPPFFQENADVRIFVEITSKLIIIILKKGVATPNFLCGF